MKRIVWSTDIHLDFVDSSAFDNYIASVKDAAPDMLLITGDIATAKTVVASLVALDEELDCPIGFVLGNHDFYYGSIRVVREEINKLCKQRGKLLYLTAWPCIKLSEQVGLIGHDGWADARAGDYDRSIVMLNDYRLIRELDGLTKPERRSVLEIMGDTAAAVIRKRLPQALDRFAHVFVVTHVPPFREACWHNGQISDDEWSPHFTCEAMGEALLEVSCQYPERQITVLCGHTHSSGTYCPNDCLTILTGSAEYGFPAVNQVFTV